MKHLLIFIFLCNSFTVSADIISNGRFDYYGKITYLDGEKVIMKLNCDGSEKEFKWNQILGIYFTSDCKNSGTKPTIMPSNIENCKKVQAYVIKFKSYENKTYADSLSIKDGMIKIHFLQNKGAHKIDNRKSYEIIEWITFRGVCEADIQNDFKIPKL